MRADNLYLDYKVCGADVEGILIKVTGKYPKEFSIIEMFGFLRLEDCIVCFIPFCVLASYFVTGCRLSWASPPHFISIAPVLPLPSQ